MNKIASSRDRHEAFVEGQEDLTGVKEVTHKYTLKKDSDNKIVVSHSMRTDMLYSTEQEARDAFLDIHDAKDEADFDESEEDMENENEKSAAFTVGMKVKAKYEVKANNFLENKTLVSDGSNTGWVNTEFLKAVAQHKSLFLDIKANAIVPGAEEPSVEAPVENINMATPADPMALERYTKDNGYAIAVEPAPGASSMVGVASEKPSLLQPDFQVSDLENELKLGVNRELEHLDDPAKALEIAIDHLAEDKQYYTKLNKVLPEMGPEEKPERTVNMDSKPNNGGSLQDAVNSYDFYGAAQKYMTPEAAEKGNLHCTATIEDMVQDSVGQLADSIISILKDKHSMDFAEMDQELSKILDSFKNDIEGVATAEEVKPAAVDESADFESKVQFPTNEEQDNYR